MKCPLNIWQQESVTATALAEAAENGFSLLSFKSEKYTDCVLDIQKGSHKYDALGHLQKDNRNGNPSLQTEYSYNIRSWLKELSNPLFRQTLHYTDGIGTSYYSGNISSMTWQNGTGQPERGYKFEYDLLDRLTNAHYGEGSKLSENSDRYTEQITDYDKMGNILGLLRYGKTSSAGYGLVDNLSFALDGNRLKSVNDAPDVQGVQQSLR